MLDDDQLYVIVDIETDGPVPGLYSMLSIGAIANVNGDKTEVTGMTRRPGNVVDYEVVDVYGITDGIAQLADEIGRGFPTAIKHSIPDVAPQFLEYEGDWAHFETPQDFEAYAEGAYGHFDYR